MEPRRRRADAAGQRGQVLPLTHQGARGVEDVQAGGGVLLERGGDRPLHGPQGLGEAQRERAALHHARPRVLRGVRRHRAREPRRSVLEGRPDAGSEGVLRVSARHREHPQRDVRVAHRHLREGQRAEEAPVSGHPQRAHGRAQGAVGAQVDSVIRVLRRAPGGVRVRGGHLLLRVVLRDLLAQEAGAHARAHLFQRAHLQGRGPSLRLRLPPLLHAQAPARSRAAAGHRQGCRRD